MKKVIILFEISSPKKFFKSKTLGFLAVIRRICILGSYGRKSTYHW